MNCYRLNGMASHVTRYAICRALGINQAEIYKNVKNLHVNGVVEMKDGKKYQIDLKEIVDENTKGVLGSI